ncbi:hypothetical protein GN958_ATG22842 [Phytophthora infestans]|uniref:Uncharacterized protein n=1 Tax=Phytophthora infestans TaxID=4787 RepID=A0A8S9TN68_PHYIN|nr:hypothetical protein GN958_ATG22842 [Phytophthora infestans]
MGFISVNLGNHLGTEIQLVTGLGTETRVDNEVGTETQLVTELGTETRVGTQRRPDLGLPSAAGSDHLSIRTGSPVIGGHQRPIDIDDDNVELELQSSPKSKGRPKQKPKAVKAKRKLITTLVQEDMEMTSKKMNLGTLDEILVGDASYVSTADKVMQLKLFTFYQGKAPYCSRDFSATCQQAPDKAE